MNSKSSFPLNLPADSFKGTKGLYTLKSFKKSGGSSELWQVLDSEGHLFALKILKNSSSDSQFKNAKKLLLREGHALALLKHPSITKIIDFCLTENSAALVMEYLDGVDLNELIEYYKSKKRQIPLSLSLEIISIIAEVLNVAHNISYKTSKGMRTGILHKDIKPSNIFITNKGEVKLLDFGVSDTPLSKNSQDSSDEFFHTPLYTCPDFWKDGLYRSKGYAPQHDIYSLGLVFYELLTNEKAFKSLYHVIEGHIEKLPANANIPDEILSTFFKMTNSSSDYRYTKAEFFLSDIKRFRPLKSTFKEEISQIVTQIQSAKLPVSSDPNLDTICCTLITQANKYQILPLARSFILFHFYSVKNDPSFLSLIAENLTSLGIDVTYHAKNAQSLLFKMRSVFHWINQTSHSDSFDELSSFNFLKDQKKLKSFLLRITDKNQRINLFHSLKKDLKKSLDHLSYISELNHLASLLELSIFECAQGPEYAESNLLLSKVTALFTLGHYSPDFGKACKTELSNLGAKLSLTQKYIRSNSLSPKEKKAIIYFLSGKESFYLPRFHPPITFPNKFLSLADEISETNFSKTLTPEVAFLSLPEDYRLDLLIFLINDYLSDKKSTKENQEQILLYSKLLEKSQTKKTFSKIDTNLFIHFIILISSKIKTQKDFFSKVFSHIDLTEAQIESSFFEVLPFVRLSSFSSNLDTDIFSLLNLFPKFKKKLMDYSPSDFFVSKNKMAEILLLYNHDKSHPLFFSVSKIAYTLSSWPSSENKDLLFQTAINILQVFEKLGHIEKNNKDEFFLREKEQHFFKATISNLKSSDDDPRLVFSQLKDDYNFTFKFYTKN